MTDTATEPRTWTLADWDPVEAAERGAKLLDEKVPGWANTVQESILARRFDMSTWDTCIVGTLELVRDWNERLREYQIHLNGTAITGYYEEAPYYGFVIPPGSGWAWSQLTSAWKAQVAARKTT